jgi:hypothetical protein
MKGGKLVFNDADMWLRDVVAEYVKEQRTIAPRVKTGLRRSVDESLCQWQTN